MGTGYLNLVLQKFLNYDTTKCFKNPEKELKENYFCMLRLGVEKNAKKSLLYCIASVKLNMVDSNKPIKLNELKEKDLNREYIKIVGGIKKKISRPIYYFTKW